MSEGGYGRMIRPCMYFARGSCKDGGACRFTHVVPYDGTITAARARMAAALPPPSLGGIDFLVRQQQHRQPGESSSQRSSDVAVPTMLLPSAGSDDMQMQQHCAGRPPSASGRHASDLDNDIICQGARQIYITFPAASTFTEDEVSAYFSGFGPVQEARTNQQARRMFGFIAFLYPESVGLVLVKGNPQLVCGSRVLVYLV